ncbi:unnamed protein product [Calicophoron daubneyi]|uniref:Ribosome maturation protein SBDS n=1 Tax=Calicophoron daubneyi TaxID=300641 RepID=A0AAV2TWV4_CALDB
MALFTPTNQKRLTNVSVVRLRKGGNRYELACYPNKVRAWRDGLETNLDEVLQIQLVFSNVSKGQFANKKDMYQVFKTEDEVQIIKTILELGELQSTEKERLVEQHSLFRDVAKIISERCVNPETNRAYTVTMIEKMMKDCHISLKTNKSAKQHALEVIRQLRAVDGFKIAPAMMEVVISIDRDSVDSVKSQLLPLCSDVIREGFVESGSYDLAVAVEPENYGTIEGLLHREANGKYCIEIVGNTRHGIQGAKGKSAAHLVGFGSVRPNDPSHLSNKTQNKQKQVSSVGEQSISRQEAVANMSNPISEADNTAPAKQNRQHRRRKHGKKKSKDDWPENRDNDKQCDESS